MERMSSQLTILESIGYTRSHQEAILRVLRDGCAHSSDEVARAGGKQYNARILELRKKGYDIKAVRLGGKPVTFNFQLFGVCSYA